MADPRHKRPLLQLIPLPVGANIKSLMGVIGKQLDMVEDSLMSLPDEFFPLTVTEESLPMWEDELGITAPALSIDERRTEVYVRHKGEQVSSKGDFIALAQIYGLTIEIIKHNTFMTRFSKTGDTLWPSEWRMRMDVKITSSATLAQVEAFKARAAQFVPAMVTGYVIYGDRMIPWR